jgi:hypothetical protein
MKHVTRWLQASIWIVSGALLAAVNAQAGVLLNADYFVDIIVTGGSDPGSQSVTGSTGDGFVFDSKTLGFGTTAELVASGYADDVGVISALSNAVEHQLGLHNGKHATIVNWVGTYQKTDPNDVFEFTVTPGTLFLSDSGGLTGGPMNAFWELSILLDGVPQFLSFAQIKGTSGSYALSTIGEILTGATFDPAAGFFGNEAFYVTDVHTGLISLAGLAVGDTFEIDYVLHTSVESNNGETSAFASIGDPFDLGSSGFGGAVISLVPEPTTLALFGLALFGAGYASKRRLH